MWGLDAYPWNGARSVDWSPGGGIGRSVGYVLEMFHGTPETM